VHRCFVASLGILTSTLFSRLNIVSVAIVSKAVVAIYGKVKTKIYEESETSLDDTQALDSIVSCFRATEKEEQKKETRQRISSPLG
jgi:hypothetical protein